MKLFLVFLLYICCVVFKRTNEITAHGADTSPTNGRLWNKLLGQSSGPSSRRDAAVVYCESIDKAIVYGGHTPPKSSIKSTGNPQSTFYNDLWLLDFKPSANWLLLDVDAGDMKSGHKATILYNNQMNGASSNSCFVLIYGGYGKTTVSSQSEIIIYDKLHLLTVKQINGENDTIVSDMVELTPANNAARPIGRSDHVFLSKGSYSYLFGGHYTTDGGKTFKMATMNVYRLSVPIIGNDDYTFGTPVWEELDISGSIPPSRRFAAAAVHPTKPLITLYGGESSASDGDWKILSDFWIFDINAKTWTQIDGVEIRNTMSFATIFGDYFLWYGGSTRVQTTPKDVTTYVYSDVGATQITDQPKGASCGSDSTKALWCIVMVSKAENSELGTAPGPRMGQTIFVRGTSLIVFGGEFQATFSDIWALNITLGLTRLDPINDNYTTPGSLQSTVYFIIAVLALLVSGFVVFVLNIRRRAMANEFNAAANSYQNPNAPAGARHSLINELPVKKYIKGVTKNVATNAGDADNNGPAAAKDEDNDEINDDDHLHDLCPICLGDYEDGDELKLLPCNHFFHPGCIDAWLVTHNACPMCKRPIDLNPNIENQGNNGQNVTNNNDNTTTTTAATDTNTTSVLITNVRGNSNSSLPSPQRPTPNESSVIVVNINETAIDQPSPR